MFVSQWRESVRLCQKKHTDIVFIVIYIFPSPQFKSAWLEVIAAHSSMY